VTGRTAADKIGEFVESVRARELPADFAHRVARAFVDTFGVAIAGQREDASRIVREYVTASGCSGASTIWATGDKVPPEQAALVNGVMGHVLDYDDVAVPARLHPSVVLLPALIALGEADGVTGSDVSAAYVVGFEVILKIARAMAWDHYARGWHSTSTLGVLGATAACAHLLGLKADRTSAAIGIAAAQAAGSRQSFGTMTKSFQAGHAAASAIRSTRLAAAGFTAPKEALEGAFGFAKLYGHGEDLHPSLDTLGEEPFEIVRAGVSVKKYPACYGVHCAVQGALDLLEGQTVGPDDVVRVGVTVNPQGLLVLIHKRPRLGLEGKFSMEYSVAAALLDGKLGLMTFTDEAVQRPEAQALLRKVEPVEEEGALFPRRALVEIQLRGGETLAMRVGEPLGLSRGDVRTEALRGSAEVPLSDSEIEAKLRDCAQFAGLRIDVDRFLSSAWTWRERPIGQILPCVHPMQ